MADFGLRVGFYAIVAGGANRAEARICFLFPS
jgi:hypothetical protein